MDHGFTRPSPPLDALVDFFWATDERYPASTALERVLPSGHLLSNDHVYSALWREQERARGWRL